MPLVTKPKSKATSTSRSRRHRTYTFKKVSKQLTDLIGSRSGIAFLSHLRRNEIKKQHALILHIVILDLKQFDLKFDSISRRYADFCAVISLCERSDEPYMSSGFLVLYFLDYFLFYYIQNCPVKPWWPTDIFTAFYRDLLAKSGQQLVKAINDILDIYTSK